jgi:hypothetical protein
VATEKPVAAENAPEAVSFRLWLALLASRRYRERVERHLWRLILVLGVLPLGAWPAFGADRLILRDLTVLRDRTVVACDEDGARLDEPLDDGRRLLRWDEIARGKVAEAQQGAFDQFLQELGLPLLRLRQRLKTGDYRALLEPAQNLAPRFHERKSDAAYLVAQSLMWGALANGEREAALAPYLRALELLRTGAADAKRLPGERRLAFDSQTGLSPELLPLWFDREAAREAMPQVRDAITAMSTPRPEGTRLYFGTLALVAGDDETAGKMLDGWNPEARSLAELRRIALAEREVQAGTPGTAVAALKAEGPKLLPQNRALAEYWLAIAAGEPEGTLSRQDAALDLLAIAARYGTSQPAISAAAIDRARQLLADAGEAAGAAALARELAARYPTTWHARRLQAGAVAPGSKGGVK